MDARPHGGRGAKTIPSVAVHLALFWAASIAILIVAGIVAGQNSAYRDLITAAIAALGTMMLTLAFLRREGRPLSDVGLSMDAMTPARFLTGAAIGLGLVAAHLLASTMLGHVHWTRSPPASAGHGFALAAATFLLLAAREELAFRGYPLLGTRGRIGTWPAQIVVATAFVIEHRLGGANWSNALLGSGLGALVFGAAALRSGGLALPLGIHVAYNFGDWLRGGKGGGGIWRAVVEPGFERYVSVTGLACYAAIMTGALVLLWPRRRDVRADIA